MIYRYLTQKKIRGENLEDMREILDLVSQTDTRPHNIRISYHHKATLHIEDENTTRGPFNLTESIVISRSKTREVLGVIYLTDVLNLIEDPRLLLEDDSPQESGISSSKEDRLYALIHQKLARSIEINEEYDILYKALETVLKKFKSADEMKTYLHIIQSYDNQKHNFTDVLQKSLSLNIDASNEHIPVILRTQISPVFNKLKNLITPEDERFRTNFAHYQMAPSPDPLDFYGALKIIERYKISKPVIFYPKD